MTPYQSAQGTTSELEAETWFRRFDERLKVLEQDRAFAFWCFYGTRLRETEYEMAEKLEQVRKRYMEARMSQSERPLRSRRGHTISDGYVENSKYALENQQKRLDRVRRNRALFEAEAHRQGILPGWLRCDR